MPALLDQSLQLARRAASRVYAALVRLLVPDVQACFDVPYYLDRYPDVRRSGMDPLGHFLLYGAREGRQPSPFFDVQYYTAVNRDVVAAGANPLLHFLRYGWREGRRPNALFDAEYYAAHSPGRGKSNPFNDYVARRKRGEHPQGWLPFTLPREGYQVATKKTEDNKLTTSSIVDIIICVYGGLPETRRCLESLLGSACQSAYEIVLVNDCSPDPALTGYLRDAAQQHGLTLLENSENLGFAGSVNRGLALHPDRDVVLLNNDTEVANNWLDRLAAAALAKPRIATATPFSNNATICSYPKFDAENRLPKDVTLESLDQIFRCVNGGYRVTIPTAVGFCMYIRRDCLNEVGTFRAELFGKGYGEENDFCMRSLYKGWEHVLAADVFVYHAGETSFGAEAVSRRKIGSDTLRRLYPEYDRMIGDHIRRDPAKAYRIAVSAWRMRHSGRPVILAISHGLGGGVEQYVSELHTTLGDQAEMLVLLPGSCGAVVLQNLNPGDNFSVALDLESEYEVLVELLRRCGVSRLHVQHLLGHTLDVERLKNELDVPLDFSVHDYFAMCPQVTLTDEKGRYCGEPDAAGCNACLAGRPPWPRLDIEAWRRKYAQLLKSADRVIAPSQDTAARMHRYFPAANLVTAAHPGRRVFRTPAPPAILAPDQPLIIAVLGVMSYHKGLARLRACADASRRKNLPLQFVLVGYADKSSAGIEPFIQTGPYKNDQLPGLLRQTGAQVVWFPAQWPETFSYTLSACLEMGLAVITPDLGAFAERVAGRGWTWVVPWDWEPEQMVEFFLSVRREHFLTGLEPPVSDKVGSTFESDFYPARYLSKD